MGIPICRGSEDAKIPSSSSYVMTRVTGIWADSIVSETYVPQKTLLFSPGFMVPR